MDRLPKVVFFLSAMALAVLYGSFGAVYYWFPHKQIRQGLEAWFELSENWRNDLQLEPTRHLVDAAEPGSPEFVMHDAAAAMPGDVLTAGLSPGRDRLQGATLYAGDGHELHHWSFDYESMDPKGPNEFNVMVHGVTPLEDGSLVVAFDAGHVLARIDACGAPLWVTRGAYHHSITPAEDGTLWTLRDESVVSIDPDTGKELSAFDIRQDVVIAHGLYGSLGVRTLENQHGVRWFDDPFHINDVEPLRADMAAAFPMFAAGDLLVSLRELNLVGVIDPATRRFKWYREGPWFKQHDPDFESDGHIAIYDNRMGLGASRIVAIVPGAGTDTSGEIVPSLRPDPEGAADAAPTAAVADVPQDDVASGVTTLLADSPTTPFYSWRRGKHQRLANGNRLVTESERGRVFEVTGDGRLVWERRIAYDDARNAIVTSAEHLPADFFRPGALECP